jgi:hypothetical protein
MPIFGIHTNAATPSKSRLISGPMHARHVGGVSITGGTGGNTSLDSYFAPTSLEPDELPSHMYAASGVTEVPRRSNTFTNAVRRPSLSLKRSLSRLRSGSISQSHKRSQSDNRPTRPGTAVSHAVQRKPSPEPAGPNVSPEWDVYAPKDRSKSAEVEIAPPPPPKDLPRFDAKLSMYSMSTYSIETDYETVPREDTPPPLPVRPKRSDSGTGIDFDDVPEKARPLGFKEIAAMRSYKDRMALYEKTRDYWANAEHGLAEWTGRTGGPRTLQLRREAH